MLFSLHSFIISSDQMDACTSPICALLRKYMHSLLWPIPPPMVYGSSLFNIILWNSMLRLSSAPASVKLTVHCRLHRHGSPWMRFQKHVPGYRSKDDVTVEFPVIIVRRSSVVFFTGFQHSSDFLMKTALFSFVMASSRSFGVLSGYMILQFLRCDEEDLIGKVCPADLGTVC